MANNNNKSTKPANDLFEEVEEIVPEYEEVEEIAVDEEEVLYADGSSVGDEGTITLPHHSHHVFSLIDIIIDVVSDTKR